VPRKLAQARYDCPVEATLDVIGGKWKGVILYNLVTTHRFSELQLNELQLLIPGVSRRMLTLQLRELERDGLIHREVYREVPATVESSLTEIGQTVSPLSAHMPDWGEAYARQIQALR